MSSPAMTLPRHPYLGPATVQRVDGDVALVQIDGAPSVRARLALFIPYRPAIEDEVLVCGDERQLYVVGVLAGHGRVELSANNVKVAARSGHLRLSGRRGVAVNGATIRVRAGRELSMAASRTHELFDALERRVHQGYEILARELVDRSETSWLVRAGTTAWKVKEAVFVNSEVVRAG